jgi:hypothetical protein
MQLYSPEPVRELETARPSLHVRAADNLAFIRTTMANSASFTGVSGIGMMGMGVVALVGAWYATQSQERHTVEVLLPMVQGREFAGTGDERWLAFWFAVALFACGVGLAAMLYKCREQATPVWRGAGRKFLLNFAPAILAGIALSEVFYELNLIRLMPGMWMMLYGAAVITGGAFSIRLIPIMGVLFMLAGVTTFYLPPVQIKALPGVVYPYDLVLAGAFGGLHIIFGFIIARRHGG